MLKLLMSVAILAGLASCDKPIAVETCRAPILTPHVGADSYAGQRERADLCVKAAAFELTRAGGPVAAAATTAVTRCRSQEASAVRALAKEGHAWPYQRARIHEDLSHLASLTAIQARSLGCGKAPGQGPDTL